MFKRFLLVVSQITLLFLFTAQIVAAQEDQPAAKKGPIFAADDEVRIEDNVNGAVFAAGGSVTVDGNVTQDVVIAGGTIRINGQVDQDVYAAGGSVFIDGTVKGNVIVAGGEVQLGPNAQVEGTMISAGERLGLGGNILGGLYAGGQNIRLNGLVGEDVYVGGERLLLGSEASIGGNLTGELSEWTGTEIASIAGQTDIKKIDVNREEKAATLGGKVAKAMYRFLWRSFVLAAAIFLVPQLLNKAVTQMQTQTTSTLVTGVMVVFGLPFLLVVLMLTIIGILPAVLGWLAYFGLLLLAWVVPSLWAGRRLLPGQNEYVQAILGVAVIVALSMIPFAGALVQLVLAAFGVGALVRVVKLS